jgi:hypothetical protein
MLRMFCFVLIGCCIFVNPFFSQATVGNEDEGSDATSLPRSSELQRSFEVLNLGMSYEETLQVLQESAYFNFRGLADVSLRPSSGDPILQVQGNGYVQDGILQFHENTLFSLTLIINQQDFAYSTFYKSFTEQYGNPNELNPNRAVWENVTTRISLEKPLSIQYLDMTTFNRLLEESLIQKSAEMFSKDIFLEEFQNR